MLLKNVAYPPILAVIALQLPLRSWRGFSSEMEVQNVRTQQTLPSRLISPCVVRACGCCAQAWGVLHGWKHSQAASSGKWGNSTDT